MLCLPKADHGMNNGGCKGAISESRGNDRWLRTSQALLSFPRRKVCEEIPTRTIVPGSFLFSPTWTGFGAGKMDTASWLESSWQWKDPLPGIFPQLPSCATPLLVIQWGDCNWKIRSSCWWLWFLASDGEKRVASQDLASRISSLTSLSLISVKISTIQSCQLFSVLFQMLIHEYSGIIMSRCR